MNDQQLEDLKQFIDGRIGQLENRMESRFEQLDSKFEDKIEALRHEMLDGFAGVGEAIDEINRRIDEYLVKA